MSIDALILLAVPETKATRALQRNFGMGRSEASLSVRKVGPKACVVVSPRRALLTAHEAAELLEWVRTLVDPLLGHRDPRGVLSFPDELHLRARTYEGAVRAVGSQGFWLTLRGKPAARQSEAVAVPKRPARRTTMPPKALVDPSARGPNFACLVMRSPAALHENHPAAHRVTRLTDGSAIVAVKELFEDIESLVTMLVDYYPALGRDALEPRGLLVLPVRAYPAVSKAAGYEAIVAEHGARAAAVRSAPPTARCSAMWLHLDDIPSLRASLQRRREEAWRRHAQGTRTRVADRG